MQCTDALVSAVVAHDSPPLCPAVIRYDLISMPEYTLSSILPFVRSGLRRVRPSFTLTEYANATWTELENSGAPVRRLRPYAENNPDNPEFTHNNEPDSLRQSAVDAWQYLQRRGFAIPASRIFPSALDDLRLELTKLGREWVDGQEPIPELSAEYLAALQRMVPNLDEVVREYVVEGLGSFEHDRFRAATVMVGAASEKALYMLAEKMLDAISTPKWKVKFTTLMAHGSAKLSRQTLLIYVSVPESLSCLDENVIPERGVREFFRSAIR